MQKLIESGGMDLYWRTWKMAPLALRLTDPKVLHDFLNVDDHSQITLEDTKGLFIILIVGCTIAVLSPIKRSYSCVKKCLHFLIISCCYFVSLLRKCICFIFNKLLNSINWILSFTLCKRIF